MGELIKLTSCTSTMLLIISVNNLGCGLPQKDIMDLLAFRLELVHLLLLLEGYSCRKHRRPSFHDSEGTSTECCRLVKVSEVKMKRGKCCHCSQKRRKIHHTTFACGKCRVCLCKTPCFYNYHKGKQFPFLSNDDILV